MSVAVKKILISAAIAGVTVGLAIGGIWRLKNSEAWMREAAANMLSPSLGARFNLLPTTEQCDDGPTEWSYRFHARGETGKPVRGVICMYLGYARIEFDDDETEEVPL